MYPFVQVFDILYIFHFAYRIVLLNMYIKMINCRLQNIIVFYRFCAFSIFKSLENIALHTLADLTYIEKEIEVFF